MEEMMARSYKIIMLLGLLGCSLFFWLLYSAAGVPILAYHRVNEDQEIYSISPGEFEEQMKYLVQHGYTAISLQEMFEAFAGRRPMPAKPVVITFDDGYADNYLTALPIMEKYRMKATVFIIPAQVGQPEYLTWEDINAMRRRNTEIGSHTLSHASLREITPDEQLREIADSKAIIEKNIASKVEFLAYPYGEFTTVLFDILRDTGYRGACTGVAGLNLPGGNVYTLKRINVPRPRYGLLEFRLRLLRANLVHTLSR
jgi:peptidoglycan/xylan/chitin deacetylase (PgdA/CDA1 family)